ncbi:MAG: pitrilysin family protein [Fibrobacterota bacterium]
MRALEQRISRTRLAPRLTVVSERVPGVRSVSLGFWVDRGARDETRASMGLSHLYEHMIFKGTRRRSPRDIAGALEKSGGSLNAFTGKEQVCLHARFVDDELANACDVIRDIFCESRFDSEELAKEKQVVIEEIRGSEDNPEDAVQEALMGCLYPGHPLGFPIAGQRKNLNAYNRASLLAAQRAMQGARLVVTASGSVDHRALCREFCALAALSGSGAKRPGARRAPAPSRGCRRVLTRDILQANVALGFRACPYASPDKFALIVLNTLLGDGMCSRLFQSVREELGLVYTIFSFAEAFADTGILGVYFGTEPAKCLPALTRVLAEIRALTEKGVTPAELDFAKSYIRGGLLLGMENTGNRMGQLARSELYLGKTETVLTALRQLERITGEDLKHVARKYLTPANLSVAVVGPRQKGLHKALQRIAF